jgi:calcineurin-like phosphoesterase
MGWYLDGRASAVIGTHTHVQSAEARVLPRGTGFITDVGMCGPYDSVIGMQVDDALIRLLKGRPSRLRIATNNLKFAGAIIEIDEKSGKCLSIQRQLVTVAPTLENRS